MRAATVAFCVSVVLLAGCASIGPPAVVRDRFDYVSAMSVSDPETILRDTPMWWSA